MLRAEQHVVANRGETGRGGWGHAKARADIDQARQREQDDLYRDDHDAQGRNVPAGEMAQDEEVPSFTSFIYQTDTPCSPGFETNEKIKAAHSSVPSCCCNHHQAHSSNINL